MALRRPAAILLVTASLFAPAVRAGAAGGGGTTTAPSLSTIPPVPLPSTTTTAAPTSAQPSPVPLPRTGGNDILEVALGAALFGAGMIVRFPVRGGHARRA